MKWFVRIAITLVFCFVFFGAIQNYLHLSQWMAVLFSIVLAIFTALGATIDFAKKWNDARKGSYELRALERREKAESSRIQTPTTEELTRFGQSHVERTLNAKIRNVGADALKPRSFIVDSREEKL